MRRNNGLFPSSSRGPTEKERLLDLKELKEILQILEEKEITEFELEEEGMKLRIRKASAPSGNHGSAPAAAAPLMPVVLSAMPPPPASIGDRAAASGALGAEADTALPEDPD